jgi:hypothetical protein
LLEIGVAAASAERRRWKTTADRPPRIGIDVEAKRAELGAP